MLLRQGLLIISYKAKCAFTVSLQGKKALVHIDIWMWVFITAVHIVAPNWRWPRCLLAGAYGSSRQPLSRVEGQNTDKMQQPGWPHSSMRRGGSPAEKAMYWWFQFPACWERKTVDPDHILVAGPVKGMREVMEMICTVIVAVVTWLYACLNTQ